MPILLHISIPFHQKMKHYILLVVLMGMLSTCNTPDKPSHDSFPLKTYVEQPDEAFRYEIIDTVRGKAWTEYRIRMVSGTWLTEAEVKETEWWHWLTMVVPDEIKETESMIIIGNGTSADTEPMEAWEEMIQIAGATGSIVSRVSNVPFQPVNYTGDTMEGVVEEDLISFAWRQYLDGGATDDLNKWNPYFPMTRAAVRAMDVVQEIGASVNHPVDSFFVTGASKRGWTTYTVAAVDNRVMAIAPVVIDLLNLIPSFHHHWRCYGAWTPALLSYDRENILNRIDTDEFKKLMELAEPYEFTDRLTMPKLLINATDDEFFVTDSWKFYWDDLSGPKYMRYMPNAGHDLLGTHQPSSLVSFYRAIITNKEIPGFDWRISGDTIYVNVDPSQEYVLRKWEAVNETGRDFRLYVVGTDAWKMEEMEILENGEYAIPVTTPERGYKGAMVEVIYNPESDFPFTFTTGTLVLPDRYPFDRFVPQRP